MKKKNSCSTSKNSIGDSSVLDYISSTESKLADLRKEIFKVKKSLGIENLEGIHLKQYYLKKFAMPKGDQHTCVDSDDVKRKPSFMSGKDLDNYLKNPQYNGPYNRQTRILNQMHDSIPEKSMQRLCCKELMRHSSAPDGRKPSFCVSCDKESMCGKYLDAYLKNPNETTTQYADDDYDDNESIDEDLSEPETETIPRQSLCAQYLDQYFKTFENQHMCDRDGNNHNPYKKSMDLDSNDDTQCSCDKCARQSFLRSPNSYKLPQVQCKPIPDKFFKLNQCQCGPCYQLSGKRPIPTSNKPPTRVYSRSDSLYCKCKAEDSKFVSHYDREWIADRGKKVVNEIKRNTVLPFEIPEDDDKCRTYNQWHIASKPKKQSKSKFMIKPYDPYVMFNGNEK